MLLGLGLVLQQRGNLRELRLVGVDQRLGLDILLRHPCGRKDTMSDIAHRDRAIRAASIATLDLHVDEELLQIEALPDAIAAASTNATLSTGASFSTAGSCAGSFSSSSTLSSASG